MNHHCRATILRSLVAATALAAAMAAPAAHATNGYFAHGYSTKSNGLAGAGVALPQDAMAAATNPAGMALVGQRVDGGLALFGPIREYTVTGNPSGAPGTFPLVPASVESDNELFYIPHIGVNWSIGANDTFGVSIGGNGGMNTDYPASGTGGLGTFYSGGATGVDLAQLFVGLTWGHKLAPNTAVGVTPIFVYQRFEAYGLQVFAAPPPPFPPLSTDGAALSNNGHDDSYGGGVKFGFITELAGNVTLGASYQTKLTMSEFDKYAGLFPEHGGFDIPATGTIGFAWRLNPANTLALDIQEIFYSDVKSLGTPLLPSLGLCATGVGSSANCLGGSNGSGFGWEDMTIFKLGWQWMANPDFTLRAGVSYGDQPIPDSEVMFNILAPAVIDTHLTAGFTWAISQVTELNFAAMYAPENTVRGPNPLDPAQMIEISMHQYDLEASIGFRF